MLDWTEQNAVTSSIHFEERTQYQGNINASQLINQEHVTHLISDDNIFTFFRNIQGTPLYYKNILLDVLVKICQSCVYRFFLTCSDYSSCS